MTTPLETSPSLLASDSCELLEMAEPARRQGRMAQDQNNSRERRVQPPDIGEET